MYDYGEKDNRKLYGMVRTQTGVDRGVAFRVWSTQFMEVIRPDI